MADAAKGGDCARCKQLEDQVEWLSATISALRRQLAIYELPSTATEAVGTSNRGDLSDATEDASNQRESEAAATEVPAPSATVLSVVDAVRGKDPRPDPTCRTDTIEDLLFGLAISTPPTSASSRSPPANRHVLNNTRGSHTRLGAARDRRRLNFDGAL